MALRRLLQRQAICLCSGSGGRFLGPNVVAAGAADTMVARGVVGLPDADGCAAVPRRGRLSGGFARAFEPMAPDANDVARLHSGQRLHRAAVYDRALGESSGALGSRGDHTGVGVRPV